MGGADRVTVVFDGQVAIQQSDLVLKGRDHLNNEMTYSYTGFSFFAGSGAGQYQASWAISGTFGARQVSMKLLSSATNVRDLAGNALDGEWTNPTGFDTTASDTFPSGDGTVGGDFQFFFTSLPGDANRDNIVDGADYSVWADNYLRTGASFIQADFSGNGVVDSGDYTLWADNFLADFRGSFTQFGLMMMMGGDPSTNRALARSYVMQLYQSGARSWKKDAGAILASLDSAFASLSNKQKEAEFFEFEWLDQLEMAAF